MKAAFLVGIILFSALVGRAQDRPALYDVLKPEKEATELINNVRAYSERAPWSLDVLALLCQRLAIKGLTGPEIFRVIVAGGEVSAALQTQDEGFAEIVWITAAILKAPCIACVFDELEHQGVPAWDLIAEILEKKVDEIRQASGEGRLNARPIFTLLTESYLRRYKGMAEKLAKTRRQAQP